MRNLLILLINVYMLIVLIRALYTWVRPDPSNRLARAVYALTEPALAPLRGALPPLGDRIDISPLVLLVFAEIVKRFIASL